MDGLEKHNSRVTTIAVYKNYGISDHGGELPQRENVQTWKYSQHFP